MRSFISSPHWLFFYAFFIASFIPFFFIRFDGQVWIYNLLYRPNGIAENMTVLLYVGAASFSGWLLFKHKNKSWMIIGSLAVALFMIGEETRWGLGFFVDDLRDLYLTGVQDILMLAVRGIPVGTVESESLFFMGFLLCLRIVLSCAIGAICVTFWYYRHLWPVWKVKGLQSSFPPYILIYGALIVGVIILELFIQPGPRKFDYIEETFELNAAVLWFLLSYELRMLFHSPHAHAQHYAQKTRL